MIYLALATLSSAGIALILKYSSMKGMNKHAVTNMNYCAASIIMLFFSLKTPLVRDGGASFLQQFPAVVLQNQGLFSPAASIVWAVITGILTGSLYYASFIFYQKSIDVSGAAISSALGKLGNLFPMMLSLILWKDYPGVIQWIGIFLAILSIVLLNFDFQENILKNIRFMSIYFMLLSGFGQFMNKIYQQYAVIEYKDFYLFVTFLSAFLLSLGPHIKNTTKENQKDRLTGLIVGIPNCLCSFFLVLSLNELNTAIVYPVFSAGVMALVSVGSVFFFKEKLNRREMIALGLTFLALICINIS